MEIYKRLQEVFSKSSELKGLVGLRFYSIAAKDDEELPYVVASSMEKPLTKDGLKEIQLQVSCCGTCYSQSLTIVEVIQKLLEKESGFVFRGIGDGKEREKFEIIITYKVN